MNGMNNTGLLIFDASDDELELLRAVRDGDVLAGGFSQEVVTSAVDKGLVDHVGGSYGGLALITPGRHTLWHHDRTADVGDPWEQCVACGSTNVNRFSPWSA